MVTVRWLLTTLIFATVALNTSFSLAAPPDEDDEEFRPGLVAEYRVGERAVTRIDPDVAFAWDEAAPDSRLSAERFEATWRGFLLVRQEAKHRLHAFVQGDVTVELDGRRVLHGSAKQPQWISGDEFVPGFAERPLVVTFRKTEPAAQLKLFWSSDSFGLEPLPPELLFYDPSRLGLRPDPAANQKNPDQAQGRDGVPTYALIELGRKQFEAFRCGRCHQRDGEEPPPPGPSLKHFAAGGFVDDVVIRHLSPFQETDRVYPTYGSHDPDYDALEVFLHQQSQPVEFDKPKSVKDADLETERRKGEVLLRSTGCLACHRIGELGGASPSPFVGPDLSNVGERRTLPWLVTWLAKPERLNADHRMPVFNLSDGERNQLALALWNLTSEPDTKVSLRLTAEKLAENWKKNRSQAAYKSFADRGRQLAIELRCAACHQFSDNDAVRFEKPASDLSQPVADWSKSCLAERADHAQLARPIFGTNLNREAIKAYLASRRETKLSPLSTFARGQKLLEQKGCLACHSRHGVGGFGKMAAQIAKADKDLNGQAPALGPPSLNAVGDKLLDEALNIAARGERQPIRMPWLKVRMPKFKHSPDELATLTRYFVEHDRIPPNALWPVSDRATSADRRSPTSRDKTPDAKSKKEGDLRSDERRGQETRAERTADAHTLLAGQALTGVRGWSCIACHKIGDYEPKQVALGARGSDLKMLGKHIRPEFFFRWIASPLRVIPGVEMPQFNRPVAGVLDGNLSRQHAALWQALNDPSFQPPTNPANVEQLWVVNPGERPRIVRDVFQLPKELGGGTVSRGFAVGLNNGHSFLFDAETMAIRQWTFGDFARQQVVGKRWLWEMAGAEVVRSLPPTQFAIRTRDRDHVVSLMASTTEWGQVQRFEVTSDGIWVQHSLVFRSNNERDENVATITIEEWIEPFIDDHTQPARSGIRRSFTIREPWDKAGPHSDKFELWFGRPRMLEGSGHPQIDVVDCYFTKRDFNKKNEEKLPWGTGNAVWQQLIPKDQPGGQLEWTELPVNEMSEEFRESRKSRKGPIAIGQATIVYSADLKRIELPTLAKPAPRMTVQTPVNSVPGFDGTQLPLDASIMPTGFNWHPNDQLVFTSLKGHLFVADDSNGDGSEDRLTLLHEGLCAPYGVLIPNYLRFSPARSVNGVLVATKSALIQLSDNNRDGYLQQNGPDLMSWGFTDDYHEWASGPVSDSKGTIFIGLASDYTDKNRPKDRSLWRGKVIRKHPGGMSGPGPTKPVGHAFRYPTGIAINERDEVFVSDQQGVQNCFNEINYLVEGAHYGVPSTHEEDKDAPETKAAIQIPHPWTRSVNGLVFLTGKEGYPDLKGHGIGCEYNGRFLIRFSTQRVGDVMQGAVYPFSLTDDELVRGLNSTATPLGATNAIEVSGGKPAAPRQQTVPNFEGPLCCGVSPKGEIYIGSIADSGWAGGQNTGSIVKLKGNGQRPNGIREIRATREGFDIDFFAPVDRARATNPEHYSISGYTRVWGGAYATPDSDRHRCKVLAVELSADGQTAKLKVDSCKTPNYVYDISCREVAEPNKPLWPDYGFFTLHKIPNE